MKFISLFMLSLLASSIIQASDLTAFASDGCSAFPDGNISQNTLWLDCCIAHDRAYWLGGTYAQRQAADEMLQQCVAAQGEPKIAALMLSGVRVGGTPWLPTSFRWGYGWPWPRGYKPLTDEEKILAERVMLQTDERQDTHPKDN